jgi:hypothetical protein
MISGRFLARAASALSLLAALSAVSCMSDDGGSEPSAANCPDLSSKYFRDSIGDGFYRVLSPNGGETFKVGDSLRVQVTSGALDSEAVIYLAVTRNGLTSSMILPGTPQGNVDPRNHCSWSFLIPDSLRLISGKKIPSASDSVRVRIAKYNFESISDYSDGYFRITP